MSLNLIHIDATTLPDAWFQAIYKCVEVGRKFKIDRGSYAGQDRLEFDYITVHVKNPGAQPLLPQIPGQYNLPNPVKEEYLNEYMPYLMTGELKPGEAYTYGSRLCNVNWHEVSKNLKYNLVKSEITVLSNPIISQIKQIIRSYKNFGYRNNQNILQIAAPSDIILNDPPCLRHIDTRIQLNEKTNKYELHFIVYFRSWDLWGGFPANLAAIQQLKEYMAGEIGVEDGEIIASSKGLHLYNYVWELAEILRGKTIEEFSSGKEKS